MGASSIMAWSMTAEGLCAAKPLGIPGTIAAGPSGPGDWGWDFDGSYNDWYGGHEIGHTRGRSHAEFCGAGGGAAYPYPGGRISPVLTGNGAIYGFDITTRAIYPPSWTDVMTYCANEWVSDFTYEGIRSYLVGTGGAAMQSVNTAAASQFLALMGMADMGTNTAQLVSVYMINQDNVLTLPDPGDWTIALLDGSDVDLATYPFAPDELTDAEESIGTPANYCRGCPLDARHGKSGNSLPGSGGGFAQRQRQRSDRRADGPRGWGPDPGRPVPGHLGRLRSGRRHADLQPALQPG